MTPEVLEQVHQHMLMIMDEIHRVCVKNNLKYYMIGGTAIGAIRHQGFIPWDPDIDIAMPREDYDKFLEIAPQELDNKFFCHHFRVDKNYYPPHAIVEKNNTRLILATDYLNDSLRPKGVYVDILPLDYVPDDEKKQRKQAKELKKIKKIKYRKRSQVFPTDSFVKRIVKRMSAILFIPLSWQYLNKKQENIMTKYNAKSSKKYICSMVSHYSYKKLTMDVEIFGQPKLYTFEGRQFYGPHDIDKYLTNLFGNYMKLPPKEEQTRLLNLFVDLK